MLKKVCLAIFFIALAQPNSGSSCSLPPPREAMSFGEYGSVPKFGPGDYAFIGEIVDAFSSSLQKGVRLLVVRSWTNKLKMGDYAEVAFFDNDEQSCGLRWPTSVINFKVMSKGRKVRVISSSLEMLGSDVGWSFSFIDAVPGN